MYLKTLIVCICLLCTVLRGRAGSVRNICEGTSATIDCPNGYHIDIINANYGRTEGSTVCPNGPILTTSCWSPHSLSVVERFCNDRSSCHLEAYNSVYGDPCIGTYKYLRVEYSCKRREVHEKTVCEGQSGHFSCLAGEEIEIDSAFYGRTDNSVCVHGPILTTSCHTRVTSRVKERCGGRGTCTVSANNNLYGDPCHGTYKYLHIKYICV